MKCYKGDYLIICARPSVGFCSRIKRQTNKLKYENLEEFLEGPSSWRGLVPVNPFGSSTGHPLCQPPVFKEQAARTNWLGSENHCWMHPSRVAVAEESMSLGSFSLSDLYVASNVEEQRV